MEKHPILLLVSLVIIIWPLIVSSIYLLFTWGAIQGKFLFWFITAFVGYALMFGIPLIIILFINNFIGMQAVSHAMEKPSLKWFVEYYWSVMAVVSLVLILLPIVSTHSIFRRKYAKGGV